MSSETPKFLIVDDDAVALDVLKAVIQSLGCECECRTSAKQVLDLVNDPAVAKEFDAIFIDVMMPEMTGLELSEELKKIPQTEHIPKVMISALGKYNDIIKGYESGSDYYMTKPIDKDQIIYALDLIFQELEDTSERFDLPEA